MELLRPNKLKLKNTVIIFLIWLATTSIISAAGNWYEQVYVKEFLEITMNNPLSNSLKESRAKFINEVRDSTIESIDSKEFTYLVVAKYIYIGLQIILRLFGFYLAACICSRTTNEKS